MDRALIVHWDGTIWSQSVIPSPGLNSYLAGISVGPGDTAWAVGDECVSQPTCDLGPKANKTLILHWDGRTWVHVASPSPAGGARLDGITAGPGDTAWAVGVFCVSSCGSAPPAERPLILHWDGRKWSRVASPRFGGGALLAAVSAGPRDNAWAVGQFCSSGCGSTSPADRPLILRWDGARWITAANPSPAGVGRLDAVSVASDGTAWGVGYSCTSACGTTTESDRALFLRWNGRRWAYIARANPPGASTYLLTVSAGQGGSAWAAGHVCTSACLTSSQVISTLILRWNGTAWVSS